MGFRGGDETVIVECRIEHRTAKAVLALPTSVGPDQVWVPKSQIVTETEVSPGLYELTIKEWFARKEGLI